MPLPQILALLFVWVEKETLQAVGLSKTDGEMFVSSAFMCFWVVQIDIDS